MEPADLRKDERQRQQRARRLMVKRQIADRGIKDKRVLAAMRLVPREAFVGETFRDHAYDDHPLPIAEGQTISQPYVVALMATLAAPGSADVVLDVGTGSGYGAAVLSRMVRFVYTIERHPALADAARQRFLELGYDNIEVQVGDGTQGWPQAAPFDAIVVAAGARKVPTRLRDQLRVGGHLIMPLARGDFGQSLVRITRLGDDSFRTEDHGAVRFVPLISDPEPAAADLPLSKTDPHAAKTDTLVADPILDDDDRRLAALLADQVLSIPDIDDPAFGQLADRFSDARIVLIGEATHGTSEFYRARALMTKRLIDEHGFTVVALEADWPDAARIDRYVCNFEVKASETPSKARFPSWMWRNAETGAFVEWLRGRNANLPADQAVRVRGLDLYSLNSSIAQVLDYLERHDPKTAAVARQRYDCLTPWQHDPVIYGQAALDADFETCEEEVIATLRDLLEQRLHDGLDEGDRLFDATQNARLVAAAERYYRRMYHGSIETWNLRDQHMFDTLKAVLEAQRGDARAVVWAHNSHVGDARATAMGQLRSQINLGQLCREAWPGNVRLVGFGTDRGTVAAASSWGGPMEIKTVRPAHRDSYEYLCRDSGKGQFLLEPARITSERLRSALDEPRLERAIGVIYLPETELVSHYLEAQLPAQFDAWLWFEETTAILPLQDADVPWSS